MDKYMDKWWRIKCHNFQNIHILECQFHRSENSFEETNISNINQFFSVRQKPKYIRTSFQMFSLSWIY